jgi:hypothetical protein
VKLNNNLKYKFTKLNNECNKKQKNLIGAHFDMLNNKNMLTNRMKREKLLHRKSKKCE